MQKRVKHDRPKDLNELARLSTKVRQGDIQTPTKEQVSLVMAELGRRGGKIGGKRRMETMTAKERTEIARKAAKARWSSKIN